MNVRDNDGRTPLHYPFKDTQHGAEIIELLLAHGADINAKDNAGRTPVDQMLQNGRQGSGGGFASARWRLGVSVAVPLDRMTRTFRPGTSAIATCFRRERGDEI